MMEPAEGLQRPFFYLLDVYARAGKELRNTQTLKDKLVMEQLQQAVMLAQELAVSHANLALTVELFPKVRFPQQMLYTLTIKTVYV